MPGVRSAGSASDCRPCDRLFVAKQALRNATRCPRLPAIVPDRLPFQGFAFSCSGFLDPPQQGLASEPRASRSRRGELTGRGVGADIAVSVATASSQLQPAPVLKNAFRKTSRAERDATIMRPAGERGISPRGWRGENGS
jgi:hypothetical protein